MTTMNVQTLRILNTSVALAATSITFCLAQRLGQDDDHDANAGYGARLIATGRVALYNGDLEAALPAFRTALAKLDTIPGLSMRERAHFYFDFGVLLARPGDPHPESARTLDTLAKIYRDKGQVEKAEQMRLQATDIRKKAIGKQERDREALRHFRTAADIWKRIDPPFGTDSIAAFNAINRLTDYPPGYEKELIRKKSQLIETVKKLNVKWLAAPEEIATPNGYEILGTSFSYPHLENVFVIGSVKVGDETWYILPNPNRDDTMEYVDQTDNWTIIRPRHPDSPSRGPMRKYHITSLLPIRLKSVSYSSNDGLGTKAWNSQPRRIGDYHEALTLDEGKTIAAWDDYHQTGNFLFDHWHLDTLRVERLQRTKIPAFGEFEKLWPERESFPLSTEKVSKILAYPDSYSPMRVYNRPNNLALEIQSEGLIRIATPSTVLYSDPLEVVYNEMGEFANSPISFRYQNGPRYAIPAPGGGIRILDIPSGGGATHVLDFYSNGLTGWAFLTPDGYYYADHQTLTDLEIRVGDRWMNAAPLDLERNRPDIISERLNGPDHPTTRQFQSLVKARWASHDFQPNTPREPVNKPSLKLSLAEMSGSSHARFRISANAPLVGNILVYQNGFSRHLAEGANASSIEFEAALLPGLNQFVAVEVPSSGGLRFGCADFNGPPQADAAFPTLHIITLGIGEYHFLQRLHFPPLDAKTFALTLSQNTPLTARTLHLESAANLQEEINAFLRDALPQDQIVFFYAGHATGNIFADRDLRLLMRTYNPANPEEEATLSLSTLGDTLRSKPPLQRVVVIDACESGDPDTAASDWRTTLPDLRQTLGAFVLAASGPHEDAREPGGPDGTEAADGTMVRSGFFTHALIEALQEKEGDADQDGYVSLEEMHRHVAKRVQELSGGFQNPSLREFAFGPDFVIGGSQLMKRSSPLPLVRLYHHAWSLKEGRIDINNDPNVSEILPFFSSEVAIDGERFSKAKLSYILERAATNAPVPNFQDVEDATKANPYRVSIKAIGTDSAELEWKTFIYDSAPPYSLREKSVLISTKFEAGHWRISGLAYADGSALFGVPVGTLADPEFLFYDGYDLLTHDDQEDPFQITRHQTLGSFQRRLHDAGFYQGPTNGLPNEATEDALRTWNQRFGSSMVRNAFVEGRGLAAEPFVRQFLLFSQSDYLQDETAAMFAETGVDYFGQKMTRRQIKADSATYEESWPYRQYSLVQGEPTVEAAKLTGDTYRCRYTMDSLARNHDFTKETKNRLRMEMIFRLLPTKQAEIIGLRSLGKVE